jgi:ATP-dependent DNA helicase RecG
LVRVRTGSKEPRHTEMARRRFRSNQRHEPRSERSFQEYVLSTPAPETSRTELLRLIRGGEDTYLELKVKLSNPEKIAQEVVALANTGGGVIIFGVNDQMRIEGVDDPEAIQSELVRICRDDITPSLIPFIDRIAFDNGRRVVALDIDGRRRPYRTRDGRFYVRVGSEKHEATREELSSLLDESRPLGYENVAVLDSALNDIDEGMLWSYVREFEGDAFADANPNGYPTRTVLEKDLLLTAGNESDPVPSVAGLLLFGRDERVAQLLPRATVTVTRYAGDSIQAPVIERLQLTGNLFSLFEATLRFISRYCDLWDERRPRIRATNDAGESPIAARANYQRAAVSEAVANLLVHRDLALRDQSTRVQIFDKALELVNPRRSSGFSPLAQKAIRYGIPQRVNPELHGIFTSAAYGLKLPLGGLPMLQRIGREFSSRRVEIVAFNDEFRLRMFAA